MTIRKILQILFVVTIVNLLSKKTIEKADARSESVHGRMEIGTRGQMLIYFSFWQIG